MTMQLGALEGVDTQDLGYVTDGVVSVAEHDCVVGLGRLDARSQIRVRDLPDRLAVRQTLRLDMVYHGAELRGEWI